MTITLSPVKRVFLSLTKKVYLVALGCLSVDQPPSLVQSATISIEFLGEKETNANPSGSELVLHGYTYLSTLHSHVLLNFLKDTHAIFRIFSSSLWVDEWRYSKRATVAWEETQCLLPCAPCSVPLALRMRESPQTILLVQKHTHTCSLLTKPSGSPVPGPGWLPLQV